MEEEKRENPEPEKEISKEPEKVEPHKEKSNEHKSKSNKETLTDKFRENPWLVSTFVLGVLALILIIGAFGNSGMTGKTVSEDFAAQKLLKFLESTGAEGLEFDSINEVSGLYEVNFLYNGAIVPIYMTKDGNLVGQLNPLQDPSDTPTTPQTQEPTEIVKSDKPLAELFIMTHCPYGTQAEKGFIPMMKTLANSANVKIRFVHYFMHDPEETETPIQVCIREEQSEKFLPYLECFLEDGDSDRCLEETNIDKAKMQECIDNGNAEKYYNEDSELSQAYGVKGSPTLIINGAQASSGRDSASYLSTICSAFNIEPSECSTELSSTSPSPMWGWDDSGSATSAQC